MKVLATSAKKLYRTTRTSAVLSLTILGLSVAAGPALSDPVPVLSVDFDIDSDGFVYADDLFNGTSQPTFASGSWSGSDGYAGGGLTTQLGGGHSPPVNNISGGWLRNFDLPVATEVTLTFRYRLWSASEFGNDECQQVLVSVDGTTVPVNGNPYVHEICGGGDTGWQQTTIDLGMLPEGTRSLELGGYINRKTDSDEEAEIFLDDVMVSMSQGVLAYDVAVTIGEDDGAQAFAYDAVDLNELTLTHALTSQPSEGTAGDNGDGTFSFDPGMDFQDLGVTVATSRSPTKPPTAPTPPPPRST